MLYLYDKALESKFKKIFNPVVYAPVDTFYERYLRSNDNKPVKLPALSLWRTSKEFISSSARSQVSVSNFRLRNDADYMARNIYSMQVKLNYQLDVWTATDIDRDDFVKELLYFLVSYPDISITYKGQAFKFPVFAESPDDVTEIAQFEQTGDIFRESIPLAIPDARYFFYEDAKTCKYINLAYYVDDNLEDERIIKQKGSDN